jgi:hypothetical protein
VERFVNHSEKIVIQSVITENPGLDTARSKARCIAARFEVKNR